MAKGRRHLLIETAVKWMDDQCPRMAAALSYYTIFSMAPLLLLTIAIAGLAFGQEAAEGEYEIPPRFIRWLNLPVVADQTMLGRLFVPRQARQEPLHRRQHQGHDDGDCRVLQHAPEKRFHRKPRNPHRRRLIHNASNTASARLNVRRYITRDKQTGCAN